MKSAYDKDKAEAAQAKWGRMLRMNERLGLTPWTKVGTGVGVRQGSTHYYNLDTGESVWTDEFHPEWLKIYSRKKIKYCWCNQFTNQVVWRKPKSYKKPVSKALLFRFMEPGPLKSAMLIQDAFRKKQERFVQLVKAARENAHTNVEGWVTMVWYNPKVKKNNVGEMNNNGKGGVAKSRKVRALEDTELNKEKSGEANTPDVAPYYFHGRSGRLLWKKPVELRDAELKLQGMEAGDRPDNVVVNWVTCSQKKPNPDHPKIVWDEEVGTEFYYNILNGKLIIGGEKNKPKALLEAECKLPEWIRLYDPFTSKYYYFNQKTNESKWRKPKGYKKPPRALLLRGLPMRPELKSAIIIQNMYRRRKARSSMRRKRAVDALASGEVEVRLNWIELWDYGWKCYYYFKQGPPEELRWKKPYCLIKLDMPTWVKLYSPGDTEFYYYNNFTEQISWQEPSGYVEPPKGFKMHFLMSPEVSAATTIQNAYRARQARKVKCAREAKAFEGEAIRGWVKMPKGYYWCVETNEVTWKKPPQLGGGENSDLVQEWSRLYSPADERYYYYSNWSHETTWEQPPDFIEPAKGLSTESIVGPYMRAVLTIQGAWRTKIARREKRKRLAALNIASAINGWVVMECRWKDRRGWTKKSSYWWNTTTDNITWEKPEELGGGVNENMAQEWVKIYSPPDERFYYYSNWTKKISWTIPNDYKDLPSGMAARMFMNPEVRAALTIQGTWRKKIARRVTRAAKARHLSMLDNGRVFRGWVTEWDSTAKADFYYNIDTGEISWKLPAALMIPKWVKVHDPTTCYFYYVNNDTGEQRSETPEDYQSPRGPHAKLLGKLITNPELRSAMTIQRAFRSRQARRLAMASTTFRRLIEEAETLEAIIPKNGALGFHLAEPEGDVGGSGVGEGALAPGIKFQQYPAVIKSITKNGQAEKAGLQAGDLLSSVSDISLIGKDMKDAIQFIRKQDRPLKLKFRRRFVPDPAWPRIKYPRISQAHMGWLECDFKDAHYGRIRYWWKIDTHHLTIIPPPPFAALEQARKEALMYQPRSPEMKQRFRDARALVDKEPRNPKYRMVLARLHLEDNNAKGAMKQMERVQKTPKLMDDHGDGWEVWELVGDAYFAWYHEEWKKKDLHVAWKAYQKMAQRMHVPKPHALMNLAKCYEYYGSYEGAALVLGDLISLHKDWEGFDEAVFHAGVLLKHLKQYTDSALYLAYLATHDTASIKTNTIWFQVSHCYHLAGDDESAMEGISQIFHNNRRELKNRKPPITTVEEYVTSPQIWDEQGHELFEHGMYTMAADAFRHALLRAPSPWETLPETWANLALSLHRTCEREQAESVLLKGIEIHEGNEMLEKLHLKISEEYAAAAMAEQRAALMVQHRFRQMIRQKREAKVQAALEAATFQKAADMLRHILQAHAVTFLRKWRDYTKYVVGIRKFSNKLIYNGLRICMEGWKLYFTMVMKEKAVLTGFAIKIQRGLRAYNVRTIHLRAKKIRAHQDKIVKTFVRRMQMQVCVKCLISWHEFVGQMQRARGVYDRIIKRYMRFCFYGWVEWARSLPSVKYFGATQFQTTWRGMVARIELKRLKALQQKAAETIQARIRAKVARVKTRYMRWKQGVVHKKAAIKFQKVRRGYLARRLVWRDMVHGAILFQAVWRSKRCRLQRGFASRKIQVAWAVYYVKQIPLRDEAAARIQAIFRGHVCRLWLSLNHAATKITAVYRGHAARIKVDKIKGRLRKFWAHLLFSNESNGLPGNMTARMIEDGEGDKAIKAKKQKFGVALSGFLASPERHQRLVPSVWSKFPVKREQMRSLAGGGGNDATKNVPIPVFNTSERKTISWIRSEAKLPKRKVPNSKLPAFAAKKQNANRSAIHDLVNPTAPRLFADTTISSGWSSLHAIYVMPPEEERPARPPSAAVERLSYLARELPDSESVDISNEGVAQYGGYAGVYASSGGVNDDGSSYNYDYEWGESPESRETRETRVTSFTSEMEYGEAELLRRRRSPRRSTQPALNGKVAFPTPNVGLRQRKRLFGRALGRDSAKQGSVAHVLAKCGDAGLIQSYMRLRAGGTAARSMISNKINGSPTTGRTKKKTRKNKGNQSFMM
jgi:hypothetical protein